MAESCRGLATIPGESLVGASQSSPARTLLGTLSFSLHKDLHATMQTPLDLGLDIVDGVRALNLKGGGLVGASQTIPARILLGAQLVFCSLITGSDAILVALHLLPVVPARPRRGHGYNCPCTSKGY